MSTEVNTTPIESRQINGLNARNIAIGLGLFISIIATHFQDRQDRERDKNDAKAERERGTNELKAMIKDIQYSQALSDKVSSLRIQTLEARVGILEQSVEDIKKSKKK